MIVESQIKLFKKFGKRKQSRRTSHILHTKNKYRVTWEVMNDMIWRYDKTAESIIKFRRKFHFPSDL